MLRSAGLRMEPWWAGAPGSGDQIPAWCHPIHNNSVPDLSASCSPSAQHDYSAVWWMLCLQGHCETQQLFWNPKLLYLLDFLDQLDGLPCHRGKLSWTSRTFPSWGPVGCDKWLRCPRDFFNTSLNNLFHSFTRHWIGTDRPGVSGVLFLAIIENQDISQLYYKIQKYIIN